MNLLFIVSHPAHVHFFRNAIKVLENNEHNILVANIDKDITLPLLESYKINSLKIGEHKSSLILRGIEFISNTVRLVAIIKKYNPDKIISVASSIGSWASFITGVPHYAFDDTEHARLEHCLYTPFAAKIITPSSYLKNHGRKQIRYAGYHELAYLHPNWFRPDPTILEKVHIDPNESYFVVRFITWKAVHDIGQRGIGDNRNDLIKLLGKYGKVIISNESSKSTITSDGIEIKPDQMHNLLYYATMYIGEGGTLATEAALLGTPSIFINTLTSGNWIELEEKYDLMYSFIDYQKAENKINTLLRREDLKIDWESKRKKMLSEKIDVTKFILDVIQN